MTSLLEYTSQEEYLFPVSGQNYYYYYYHYFKIKLIEEHNSLLRKWDYSEITVQFKTPPKRETYEDTL